MKRGGYRSSNGGSGGSGNRGGLGKGGGRREGFAAIVKVLEFAEERFVNAIVGQVGEGFFGVEEHGIEHGDVVVELHVGEGKGRGLELLGVEGRGSVGGCGGGGSSDIHG